VEFIIPCFNSGGWMNDAFNYIQNNNGIAIEASYWVSLLFDY
jgi:hypothetical protein